MRDRYLVIHNLLMHQTPGPLNLPQWAVVIPPSLQATLLREARDLSPSSDGVEMLQRLRQAGSYWETMAEDVLRVLAGHPLRSATHKKHVKQPSAPRPSEVYAADPPLEPKEREDTSTGDLTLTEPESILAPQIKAWIKFQTEQQLQGPLKALRLQILTQQKTNVELLSAITQNNPNAANSLTVGGSQSTEQQETGEAAHSLRPAFSKLMPQNPRNASAPLSPTPFKRMGTPAETSPPKTTLLERNRPKFSSIGSLQAVKHIDCLNSRGDWRCENCDKTFGEENIVLRCPACQTREMCLSCAWRHGSGGCEIDWKPTPKLSLNPTNLEPPTPAPCKREECPCTASWNGRIEEYCCRHCQQGFACQEDLHQRPFLPLPCAPIPPEIRPPAPESPVPVRKSVRWYTLYGAGQTRDGMWGATNRRQMDILFEWAEETSATFSYHGQDHLGRSQAKRYILEEGLEPNITRQFSENLTTGKLPTGYLAADPTITPSSEEVSPSNGESSKNGITKLLSDSQEDPPSAYNEYPARALPYACASHLRSEERLSPPPTKYPPLPTAWSETGNQTYFVNDLCLIKLSQADTADTTGLFSPNRWSPPRPVWTKTLPLKPFPSSAELPSVQIACVLYQQGLPSEYEAKSVQLNQLSPRFLQAYLPAIDYFLGQPDGRMYEEIKFVAIIFVRDLKYKGKRLPTLVNPANGIILVDITYIQKLLSESVDLPHTVMERVNRLFHEFGHLAEAILYKGGEPAPDYAVNSILWSHHFPREGQQLHVTNLNRQRLPNRRVYGSQDPREVRCDAFADLWCMQGQLRKNQAQWAFKGLWTERTRKTLPFVHELMRRSHFDHSSCPGWLKEAMRKYQEGSHFETISISEAIAQLNGGTSNLSKGNPRKRGTQAPETLLREDDLPPYQAETPVHDPARLIQRDKPSISYPTCPIHSLVTDWEMDIEDLASLVYAADPPTTDPDLPQQETPPETTKSGRSQEENPQKGDSVGPTSDHEDNKATLDELEKLDIKSRQTAIQRELSNEAPHKDTSPKTTSETGSFPDTLDAERSIPPRQREDQTAPRPQSDHDVPFYYDYSGPDLNETNADKDWSGRKGGPRYDGAFHRVQRRHRGRGAGENNRSEREKGRIENPTPPSRKIVAAVSGRKSKWNDPGHRVGYHQEFPYPEKTADSYAIKKRNYRGERTSPLMPQPRYRQLTGPGPREHALRAEEDTLKNLYHLLCRRTQTGMKMPHTTFVRLDLKGSPTGGTISVPSDLDESASMLLYRAVNEVVGYYRSGEDWRLIYGTGQITVDCRLTSRELGLPNNFSFTLAGKLRGGSDREKESPDAPNPESPERPTAEAYPPLRTSPPPSTSLFDRAKEWAGGGSLAMAPTPHPLLSLGEREQPGSSYDDFIPSTTTPGPPEKAPTDTEEDPPPIIEITEAEKKNSEPPPPETTSEMQQLIESVAAMQEEIRSLKTKNQTQAAKLNQETDAPIELLMRRRPMADWGHTTLTLELASAIKEEESTLAGRYPIDPDILDERISWLVAFVYNQGIEVGSLLPLEANQPAAEQTLQTVLYSLESAREDEIPVFSYSPPHMLLGHHKATEELWTLMSRSGPKWAKKLCERPWRTPSGQEPSSDSHRATMARRSSLGPKSATGAPNPNSTPKHPNATDTLPRNHRRASFSATEAEEDTKPRQPYPQGFSSRVLHPDQEPFRRSQYYHEEPDGPDSAGNGGGTQPRWNPPNAAHEPSRSRSRSPSPQRKRGTENDSQQTTEQDGENTLDIWRQNKLELFCKAPTLQTLQQGPISQEVLEAIITVRKLPYRRAASAPHVLWIDIRYERAPLSPRNVARYIFTQGKQFLSPQMKSDSASVRCEAWIKRRAHMVNLLLGSINSRSESRLVLDQLLSELQEARGSGDSLVAKVGQVIAECDVYIVLACSVIVHYMDITYSPDYSALTEFETCRRQLGIEVLDFLSHVERLYLRVRGYDDKNRKWLYEVAALTDPTLVLTLHRNAVRGLREGEQKHAGIIADELEQACNTARSLSRTLPDCEKAAVLQLQSVAYSCGLIGKDVALNESHEKADPKWREVRSRNRDRQNPGTTRDPDKDQGNRDHYARTVRDNDKRDRTVAAAPENFRNDRNRKDEPNDSRGGQQLKPLNSRPPPPPQGPESRFVINWKAVQEAAKQPQHTEAYKLAAMLFPCDNDCSKYDVKREAEGFPRPTVVQKTEDGKVKLRHDGTVDVRYGRGLPDPDCRRCGIFLAQPHKKSERAELSETQQRSSHNPKTCIASIKAALRAGPAGAELLQEKYNDRK